MPCSHRHMHRVQPQQCRGGEELSSCSQDARSHPSACCPSPMMASSVVCRSAPADAQFPKGPAPRKEEGSPARAYGDCAAQSVPQQGSRGGRSAGVGCRSWAGRQARPGCVVAWCVVRGKGAGGDLSTAAPRYGAAIAKERFGKSVGLFRDGREHGMGRYGVWGKTLPAIVRACAPARATCGGQRYLLLGVGAPAVAVFAVSCTHGD
jgi:hypothetical protein